MHLVNTRASPTSRLGASAGNVSPMLRYILSTSSCPPTPRPWSQVTSYESALGNPSHVLTDLSTQAPVGNKLLMQFIGASRYHHPISLSLTRPLQGEPHHQAVVTSQQLSSSKVIMVKSSQVSSTV